jgi:uncharacterized SAM-binding protein YcdF (DUF218 family)
MRRMPRLKPPGLFRRLLSLIVLVWLLGFLWFALFLPRPADKAQTDGIIALTGGTGRIQRGLAVLRGGQAHRLLVSGVDAQVSHADFVHDYAVPATLFACCVTLGYDAFDTRSNAREAVAWIAHYDLHSVRLVTTDWHMRRAAFDLKVAAPRDLVIIEDAVPSHPSVKVLFIEYNKFLARIAAWLVNWPDVTRPAGIAHGHH